jgi:hypothetical protein
MFFNPLGFDVVFYTLFKMTDSYLFATMILYTLTISLLMLYFKLAYIRPRDWVISSVKSIKKFVTT